MCLACGLCCNGVIFADVKLRRGDDATRLQALGIPLSQPAAGPGAKPGAGVARRRAQRFPQPCVAHDGCRCRIYEERPVYCREFECALLKKVKAGEATSAAAQQLIRKAKQTSEEVKKLLRELGDVEEDVALAKRFRRTSRRLEGSGLGGARAELYSRLTLAFHDLNLILHKEFYPPPG